FYFSFFNDTTATSIYTLSLHDALPIFDRGPCAYLLESVEGGEKWGRYSFLGSGAPMLLHGSDREVVLSDGRRRRRIPVKTDVLEDRKSTRLNSSHVAISYAVFCLKKKK